MNKRTIVIIVACLLTVIAFIYATRPSPTNKSSGSVASSHIKGKGTKNVTLVEYGDYQCPACASYYPIGKALVEKYKTNIFFQFRNYPLESLHKNARAAARAAEAANMQGKFWEMHDALYENQASWEATTDPLTLFKSYANSIGVADLAKFETDYKSSAVNNIINADLKEGQKFSITGTPTFILDGKKITQNPQSQDAFNKLIDDAIAGKK